MKEIAQLKGLTNLGVSGDKLTAEGKKELQQGQRILKVF
jgi:hypothetical protein